MPLREKLLAPRFPLRASLRRNISDTTFLLHFTQSQRILALLVGWSGDQFHEPESQAPT